MASPQDGKSAAKPIETSLASDGFRKSSTHPMRYATGFFTNRSDHPNARGRVRLGFPRDSFFASGLLGQRIVILQSQKLVIVRLGDSVDPTGDITGLGRPVSEVIAATQK